MNLYFSNLETTFTVVQKYLFNFEAFGYCPSNVIVDNISDFESIYFLGYLQEIAQFKYNYKTK